MKFTSVERLINVIKWLENKRNPELSGIYLKLYDDIEIELSGRGYYKKFYDRQTATEIILSCFINFYDHLENPPFSVNLLWQQKYVMSLFEEIDIVALVILFSHKECCAYDPENAIYGEFGFYDYNKLKRKIYTRFNDLERIMMGGCVE